MRKVHINDINGLPHIIYEGVVYENQHGDNIRHIVGTEYFLILSKTFTNDPTVTWRDTYMYMVPYIIHPLTTLYYWIKENL